MIMKMKIQYSFRGRRLGVRPLPDEVSQDLCGLDSLLLGQDHKQLLLRIHDPELLNFFHLKVYKKSIKRIIF
jgi:hypothetical protein